MEIVNGFQCKNCTDVDYAKQHIDPAHPKDGPYGINAKDADKARGGAGDPAVVLGGALASGGTANSESASPQDGSRPPTNGSVSPAPGSLLDARA